MIEIAMSNRVILGLGAAVALCAGTACKKDEASKESRPNATETPNAADIAATPTASEPAEPMAANQPGNGQEDERPSAPAIAVSKGLAEDGNNPKLVELVAAFESCKLTSKNPAWDCKEAIKPFVEAVDNPVDVPTLFNFLDDAKPHVRLAGASAIAQKMIMQTAEGREMGARLAAATLRETEPVMAEFLGTSILQGNFEDAEYSASVQAIVTSHPVEEIRAAVVSNLPVQDWNTYFPLLKDRLAKDSSPLVRESIMSSFYTSAQKDGACDFFADHLGDSDDKVAAKAAYNIVWTRDACMSKYDDFLKHFEERVGASKADFMYLNTTNYFAQSQNASEEQKARYFDLLEKVVADTQVSGMGRSSALRNLGKYAADGRAFAKKFVGDSEGSVAAAAKEIVKAK